MTRLKTASLAILGTAAIVVSVLASPAMAEGARAKAAKHTQTQTKGQRMHNANAALPSGRVYRRPAGPGEVAGNVAGGAVATAGAIATAPFRAFDNSYNNYYGYGYGGRDWKTYAAHNGLACTPGTTFKGPDGRRQLCQ
jgi:hypothetical protein